MISGKSKVKLGLVLVIVSIPFFLALPVLPFMNLGGRTRIILGTILISFGETAFWTGGFFLGKELLTKYKAYINPVNWFKKRRD